MHVEEWVLAYYRENGFPDGVHGEGSTLTTIFMLLMWDVVFSPVPDAFHSIYQVGEVLDFRFENKNTKTFNEAMYSETSVCISLHLFNCTG